MADVVVSGATLTNDRVQALRVELAGLPVRTIDRDTAVAWAADGHSLIPRVAGRRGTRVQLVEVGEDRFLRLDNDAVAADSLPGLPPA